MTRKRGAGTTARVDVKQTGALGVVSRRVPLGTYVPEDALWELKELAIRLSRERSQRVTLAALVSEAIADLLVRYRR